MSIIDKYKADMEEKKQRKKDLLEKVKQKQAENRSQSNGSIESQESVKQKSEVEEKLKKEIKKLEARIENTKNQLALANKSKRELQDTNKEAKAEIYELKNKIKDLELTLGVTQDELQNKAGRYEKEAKALGLQLEVLKKNLTSSEQAVSSINKSRNSIKKNYDECKKELIGERRKNSALGQRISELSKESKEARVKISGLSNEVRTLREQLHINNIDIVMAYLFENADKVDSKQFKQLCDIVDIVQSRLKVNEKKDTPVVVQKIVQEDIRLGFIVNEDLKWLFRDLNTGEFYKLYGMPLDIQQDTPVKVRINGEFAVLLKTYGGELRNTKVTSFRKKKLSEERVKVNFKQLPNINVLIVGSINQYNYINRLKLHGVDAEWHNPFEESEKRLSSKYKWADLVLVCEQHISHGVWDIVDKKDPKVQSLKKDNVNVIVSRVMLAPEKIVGEQ